VWNVATLSSSILPYCWQEKPAVILLFTNDEEKNRAAYLYHVVHHLSYDMVVSGYACSRFKSGALCSIVRDI